MVNGNVKIGGLRNVNADVNASTVNGKVKSKDLTFVNISSEKEDLKEPWVRAEIPSMYQQLTGASLWMRTRSSQKKMTTLSLSSILMMTTKGKF